MKFLITGSCGFLGSVIAKQFPNSLRLGRNKLNNLKCDLTSEIPEIKSNITTVIHCAGLAHNKFAAGVKDKYELFNNVNVKGIQNLLKGLEKAPTLPKSFVFISSVAVYGLDRGESIKENHSLNAKDPYGLSKIQAEQIVQEWCEKNNVICTILRLPLLVGLNPPGNLGAMIKGIKKGYYFNIAGGLAKKSMVMAEDVAKIILKASEIGGIYHLTDGHHPDFKELSTIIAQELNKSNPLNIPKWMANLMAKTGDLLGDKAPFNSYKLGKITADLTFEDSKARQILGWSPQHVLEAFKIK